MSVTSGIVLFAVCWFLVLFMVLPLFVKSQEEAGEVEPGTPAGAPDQPLMRKKLIWTTVAATVIWAGLFAKHNRSKDIRKNSIGIGDRGMLSLIIF